MKHFTLAFLVTAVFYSATAIAQEATIKGKITDSKTKESLIGVNVVLSDNTGVASDIDGNYELKVSEGTHIITYRFIGYTSQTKTVTVKAQETITFDMALGAAVTQLEMVVVSAGKFEQKLQDVTVSMDIVKPYLVENKNTTSMETAVNQAPGVQIVDNEVQIRGGSGYSFGAGSRVMILVDDLPLLSGDAGRPSWGFVPVENLEQMEVIKGASSVLYGSAALSGVINIRTAYPKDEPKTKINVYSGIYDNPPRTYAKPWKDNNPMYTGMNFFHARKFKNLDLVIGGNVFSDNGYVGPSPDEIQIKRKKGTTASRPDTIFVGDTLFLMRTSDSATYQHVPVNKGEFENRARMNANLRYRFKNIEGLSAGINLNGMYARFASTLIMLDTDTGMYRSFPGAITVTLQSVYNIDPYISYYGTSGNRHSLRTRYFYLDNNNNNNQANKSKLMYGEYQYQKQFERIKDFTVTTGIMGTYTESAAPLYAANEDSSGNNTASNMAAYMQLDKKFFDRLTLSGGARYESFIINNKEESKPVFRSGINYRVLRETYLRASYGQGYRFPTIAEKYIKTGVGTMNIFPNLDIKSETSWNAEIGIKQAFKLGGFLGYLDFAYFRQEFKNNIEFNFGYWGNDTTDISRNLGFRSINVGKTRVDGIDITLLGQGKISKTTINTLIGYTYTKPIALEPDLVYATGESPLMNLFIGDSISKPTPVPITYLNSSSDPSNNILKYRFQHLIKADIEATYSAFSVGISLLYNSFMQNVDKIFITLDSDTTVTDIVGRLLPTDITKYREERYNKPDYIFDVRASYKMTETSKVAVIVKNALNREYMVRPLIIEPPRTFVIQYTLEF